MIFSYDQFLQLLGLYFWPFLRIGAMLTVVPLFSGRFVPVKTRLALTVLITFAVAPTLNLPPPVSPFSWHGILLIAQQIGIGLAMGLVFAMVFEAFVVAGHLVSMAMGLAMASMVDPSTGVNTPVIGRYYSIIVSLIFLALNGHLLVIKVVVDSFSYLPVGLHFFTQDSLKSIYSFASVMFEVGVLVGLPTVTALLLVNISLGVIARAAPALNIFAVGFAVTILVGLIMLVFTTPLLSPSFQNILLQGVSLIKHFNLTG